MEKYEVYYEDVLLGILEINDEEKHKFIKNESGVEQTKDKACHIKEILTEGGYMLLCALGSLLSAIFVGYLSSNFYNTRRNLDSKKT